MVISHDVVRKYWTLHVYHGSIDWVYYYYYYLYQLQAKSKLWCEPRVSLRNIWLGSTKLGCLGIKLFEKNFYIFLEKIKFGSDFNAIKRFQFPKIVNPFLMVEIQNHFKHSGLTAG